MASVIDFMNRTAARRVMSEKHGSLLHAVRALLQRAVRVRGDLHYVAVVSYRSTKHDRPQRRYTGVKGLLTNENDTFNDLPPEVREHLEHESQQDVPLHLMGKSIFHTHGALFRAVCREGLSRSGMQALDVDVQCCYLALGLHYFPDKGSCTKLQKLLKDPNTFYQSLQDATGLTHREVKRCVLVASNLGRVEHENKYFAQTMKNLKAENVKIMKYEAEKNPALYKLYEKTPNGLAKFMSVIDCEREADVINIFDHGEDTSNEYDGVVFYLDTPFDKEAHLQRINKLIHPLRVCIKTPDPWLEMAQRKYGHLDWTHVNPMPFGQFMIAYKQCLEALKRGVTKAREIDSVFSDVARGRQHWVVTKGAKGFDVWDERKHFWITDAERAQGVLRQALQGHRGQAGMGLATCSLRARRVLGQGRRVPPSLHVADGLPAARPPHQRRVQAPLRRRQGLQFPRDDGAVRGA
jgi:hypothetical protein